MGQTHRRGYLREQILQKSRSSPDASIREIAEAVGCHPETVRRHLRYRHRPSMAFADVVMNAPEVDADELLDLSAVRHADPQTKHLAKHPQRRRLALDGDAETRAIIASQPDVRHAVLNLLSQDYVAEVRAAVARNPRTRRKLLYKLSQDSESLVREALVSHPKIDSLFRFARDRSPLVREATVPVAGRKNTKLLEKLSSDPAIGVRVAVAADPSVAQDDLGRLASDPEPEVRAAAAGNTKIDSHNLARLVDDDDVDVRNVARTALANLSAAN